MRDVITQFWVIPQKFTFFKIKINKINKRLATWRRQAGKSSCNFWRKFKA
jgi:hypothetical protein